MMQRKTHLRPWSYMIMAIAMFTALQVGEHSSLWLELCTLIVVQLVLTAIVVLRIRRRANGRR